MGKFTFSLDDKTTTWVHEQAGDDVEAYLTDLIHQDQRRKAEDQLREMLLKARDSGASSRTPQQIMADVKAELKADGQL